MSDISNRTFGIELEVMMPAGQSRVALASAIRAAGVRCAAPAYGHTVSAGWRVIEDGSLCRHTGAEIVSPILSGEAGIRDARKVADAAKAFGCTVNVKTGFHVHVGAGDFNAKQLATAALTYVWFETFFDQIMPASRRACNNQYIRSNRADFGGYGTVAVNKAFEVIKARLEGLSDDDYTGAIKACQNANHLDYNSRYRKLNLCSFVPRDNRPGYNTIEFRQHSGTVEADKIEHWVRLCVAFVDKAKTARPRPRTVTRDHSSAEEMHLFFAVFPMPRATRAFYMARRKELASADRKAARDAARAAAAQGLAQAA